MTWRPEVITELVQRARAGDSWDDIAVALMPGKDIARARSACTTYFSRYASVEDKKARKKALRKRGSFKRRSNGFAPALQRERVNPWAGMGMCFRV